MSKIRPWYLPTEDPSEGIVRRWVREKCSLRMQAVLMAAVRGCDGSPKHDPSKAILWELRFDCLNPSCQGNIDPFKFSSFMGYWHDIKEQQEQFLASLDQYPFHFVMHLTHAAEITGRLHPDKYRRNFWERLYLTIVTEHLHCNTETLEQMKNRLRDR